LLKRRGSTADLRERGGEKDGLSCKLILELERVQDGADVPLVAQLQHPVRLVQDDPLHVVQPQALRLPQMVHQAARRRDKDVHTLTQPAPNNGE
jgi:hypothetical protein